MLNPVKWDVVDDGIFTYHGAVVDETLGDRLRKAKKTKKVGNAEMAAAAGVSEVTISRWLNDKTTPDPNELDRVAEFLGVTSEWLRKGGALPGVTAERLSGQGRAVREPSASIGRRLPPRVYERVYSYLERLREAGADEEQLDVAERTMRQERYARLNKATHREPSEDEMLIDVDAGWAAVWEILTAGGMKIPGPRPRFRKAEDGA